MGTWGKEREGQKPLPRFRNELPMGHLGDRRKETGLFQGREEIGVDVPRSRSAVLNEVIGNLSRVEERIQSTDVD